MSARVLLVSTNRERAPFPVVPNGMACVASALADAGHDVRVADLMFAREPVRAAERAAREHRPDVIGVSVRNIDNSDTIALRHYTPEAAATLAALRRAAPGARVVAGGAAFGVAPKALLAAGREPGEIAGLVRMRDGEVVFAPPGEDADLDSLPQPRLHRWFDLARYERIGATVPIQTTRGCVYKCVYCTYRNVEGWGYRLRDPALVADEIAELRAHGVHHFDFVDSTFNSPPPHARDVCEAIARRTPGVTLETTN